MGVICIKDGNIYQYPSNASGVREPIQRKIFGYVPLEVEAQHAAMVLEYKLVSPEEFDSYVSSEIERLTRMMGKRWVEER